MVLIHIPFYMTVQTAACLRIIYPTDELKRNHYLSRYQVRTIHNGKTILDVVLTICFGTYRRQQVLTFSYTPNVVCYFY
jgi:hypothetical protein